MNSLVRASFVVLLLCFIGLFAVLFFLYHGKLEGPSKEIVIPHGTSLTEVSQILHRANVIRYPFLTKMSLRLTGGARKVRAGEFRFHEDMRAVEAIRVLYYGEPIVHPVTVPEGFTARQIADLLEEQNLIDKDRFLSLALGPHFAERFKLSAPSLEGYLFPDTYVFSRVDREETIIESMVHNFYEKFDKTLQEEAKKFGWPLEKVVILASIIEKETGIDEERPLVSSVFHNRMKKKMRLQSDPTTIYGIRHFDGNIRKKDLQTPTPYNTYLISGLPPGAIANPGLNSLIAAIRPAKTDFLYFVANKQGVHVFSKTYTQHSRHVNHFQRSNAEVERRRLNQRRD